MSGLIDQHKMEFLSIAYLHAVSAMAGVNVSHRIFDYGIDGTFRPVRSYKNRRIESGFPLDYQLKSTLNWEVKSQRVFYDLESKTYNDLVNRHSDGCVPILLVLLCLPGDQKDWLTVDIENLVLRTCSFWYFAPLDAVPTKNKFKTRIEIPTKQVLTPDSLLELLQRVSDGFF